VAVAVVVAALEEPEVEALVASTSLMELVAAAEPGPQTLSPVVVAEAAVAQV
jgi:hypothetical protein